ncbi:clustered mitochondria-domain-containing protein [Apodospora peruviana]|uniref:Clustered mitochondria protein homolog n=1 Tax=Apodospora peruviana TaxID=516989 RepID=A0AAE0HVQ1_9PEZI|nr:clustered mitochondria-domain-containing protein [Apodospora peruviana]
MSESSSTKLPSEPANGSSEVPETQVVQNGVDEQTQVEDGAEQVEDTPFPIKIVLPNTKSIDIHVSPLEQFHEIRQSIIENPDAVEYSCFHLAHDGKKINDFAQVSDVEGLKANDELHVVEDPYTEKEARIHFIRIRELIGAAGDRTDTIHGILAGLSVHDDVVFAAEEAKQSKGEVKEYDFRAPVSLATLLPKESEPAPKTVKNISLSPWHPPPAHLRQQGHLLYLVVSTNEGNQFHITAHAGGFYVNNCSNAKFDPSKKGDEEAHSLYTLLSQISKDFSDKFEQLQQFTNKRDPLSTFQIGNAFPSAPWIVPSTGSPLLSHSPDSARTQETYLLGGAENTDSLRDWNEEFQSAKELPKETIQDRVFRERLLCKLYSDYNDAAARGAVLVARGEVAPLNPTEDRDAQIFVYNNVFYSFGADGVGTFTSEGGDEAARVATGKDILGVKLVNQLDIAGLYTPGTIVVDYLGKRIVGQSIVPGIFKQPEDGENQIHYGAVDGKDTVAADESFAASFETLARALRIKKHTVWDKEHKAFNLEASVEMKGLRGTDSRKYVLDLYRITPLDILWMEDDKVAEYPHRMTVLRPELVESLGKVKAREYITAELAKRQPQKDTTDAAAETKEIDDKPAQDEAAPSESAKDAEAGDVEKENEKKDEDDKANRVDMSSFNWALNPDVFSGQEPQTDEDKEQMVKDEQEVRDACKYLRETVIPELLNELRESDISFPMDGRSLTRQLHRRGINLRYLGKLATLSADKRLSCFRELCVREMIARSFKHVAAKYLKPLPLPLTSSCFAHLLNCLLGVGLNPSPKADIEPSLRSLYKDVKLEFENVTPDSLKADVQEETKRRFNYTLDDEWLAQLKHLQVLREISLKLGLQLQKKDFVFTAAQNGHASNKAAEPEQAQAPPETKTKNKKKKSARDGSPASIGSSTGVAHTFSPKDFVNVVPITKDSCPRSALAEEALDAGRLSIFQNQRKLGEDLLLESLSLHEQIYGLVHPEVAQMYHTLSQLYYQLGQKDAAVELAKKAAIVAERTVGVDSAETVLNYLNLSLFLHQSGESREALQYARHALDLWKVIYGPDHPDTITTMNNYAVMLQSIQAYHESRKFFEQSLRVCETVFGDRTVHSATLLFQLAQALALDNDPKGAVNKMRESYTIFKTVLGEDDKNTKEASHWLDQLTQNAVALAKQAKETEGRRTRFKFSTMSTPAQPATAAPPTSKKMDDNRDVDLLVKYIEGTEKMGSSKSSSKRGPGNPKRRGGAAKASS